jgi:ATP-dependent RNA helicase SUPV3L1/SUV3
MRALLHSVRHGLPLPPPLPPAGRVSVPVDPAMPAGYYAAIGYAVAGGRAIRSDILDRFETAMRHAAPSARLLGVGESELPAILEALGYRRTTGADGAVLWRFRPAGRKGRPPRPAVPDAAHPFARLRELAR